MDRIPTWLLWIFTGIWFILILIGVQYLPSRVSEKIELKKEKMETTFHVVIDNPKEFNLSEKQKTYSEKDMKEAFIAGELYADNGTYSINKGGGEALAFDKWLKQIKNNEKSSYTEQEFLDHY